MLYTLGDATPEIDPTAWVAPGAHVMGRVRLKAEASVWFNAALRGDNEWIEIGARSNVQDGAVMHTDIGFPLTIGSDVTVGHGAILHGCVIEDGALIGMGAIILNGARIGAGCLVGAGALVTEGKAFEPGALVVGSPAKAARTLDPEQRAALLGSAAGYVANQKRFAADLKRID